MRALCCRSFRSNRCLVSEYEVPNFLGSQEWETFSETPCSYKLSYCYPRCTRSVSNVHPRPHLLRQPGGHQGEVPHHRHGDDT